MDKIAMNVAAHLNVGIVRDEVMAELLHVGTETRVLAHPETVGGLAAQQILDSLVVDLQVTHVHSVALSAALLTRLHAVEQCLHNTITCIFTE